MLAPRRFQAVVTLAVVALAALPTVAGVLATPPVHTYTWMHAVAPGDLGVYYSYVEQVRGGAVLLRDQFTSEPGQVGTFNLLWWLVGGLARLTRTSAEVAFHLARLALLPFLVWAFGRVASLAPEARSRWFVLLLMFAGGVGAYVAPWYAASTYQGGGAAYHWPIDLWGAHTFPFLSALHSPHSVASWALLALAAWGGYRAVEHGERRPLIVALLATLALGNFHPYQLPAIVLLPLAYALVRRVVLGSWPRAPWVGLMFAVAAFPGAAYHLWLLAHDPVVAARAAQNVTLIPPLWFVVLGFGFLLGFALARLLQRRLISAEVWALTWLLVAVMLVSLPTSVQSRFLQGVVLPLALLAAPAVLAAYDWLTARVRGLAANPALAGLLLVSVFFASPLYAVARDLAIVQAPPPGWYLLADTVDAFRWIADHTSRQAVVLASPDLGLFVPRHARRTTYVGHPHETLGYQRKAAATLAFYAGTAADPSGWLRSERITHVVVTEADRRRREPSWSPPGVVVFANRGAAVFAVAP